MFQSAGHMGSKSGSPPSAPDPSFINAQQTKSNVGTAVASRVMNNTNQVTPYGNLTYEQTGIYYDPSIGVNVPQYTATTTLSPEQKNLYDTQTRVTQGAYDLADQYTGRIGDATAQPFNYDGLAPAPQYNEDYRQKQKNAIIERNQPQMDRDRAALEQKLANQGIALGSEAWQNSLYDYNRATNDFRLGADVQAGNAAAQVYGLEGNTRDRAIQERANLRTQPINEVTALLGTGQGVQNPNFVQTPQSQVANVDTSAPYNMQYQGQMAQYQQGQQNQNAMMGGLFGLGGSALTAYGLGGGFRGKG